MRVPGSCVDDGRRAAAERGGAGRRAAGAAAPRRAVGAGAGVGPVAVVRARRRRHCDFWTGDARASWHCPEGSWNFLPGRGSYLVGAVADAGPTSFGSWQYRSAHPGELAVPEAGIRLRALRTPVETAGSGGSNRGRPILDLPAPGETTWSSAPGSQATGCVFRGVRAERRYRTFSSTARSRGPTVTGCPSSPPPTAASSGWPGTRWRGDSASPGHKVRGSLEFRAVGRQ